MILQKLMAFPFLMQYIMMVFLKYQVQPIRDYSYILYGDIKKFPKIPQEILDRIFYDESNYTYTLHTDDRGLSYSIITSVTDSGDSTYIVEASLLDVTDDSLIQKGAFILIKNDIGIIAEKYPYHLISVNFE